MILKNDSNWIYLDSLQFVNNLFLSLNSDEPLNSLLRRLFTAIIGKLLVYTDCMQGLHILSNTVVKNDGSISFFEISSLYIDKSNEKISNYINSEITKRNLNDINLSDYNNLKISMYEHDLPTYFSIKLDEFEGIGFRDTLIQNLSDKFPCPPKTYSSNSWKKLFSVIAAKENPINCSASEVLVLPFSEANDQLPCGNLGAIVLWNNSKDNSIDISEEKLLLATKSFHVFVRKYLQNNYNLVDNTYLPSFRVAGKKSVAIMFADIRNFTTVTEVSRNFGLIPRLTKFMLDYHEQIDCIVQQFNGRIQQRSGDGVMAIFGEYHTPKIAVKSAITAAKLIYDRFKYLKKQFLEDQQVYNFMQIEYEPLNFDLGIGINYGPVIFDYFGAPGYRNFSTFGDHVNFAQRLESEANRLDERFSEGDSLRAPILLSRPAWQLSDQPKSVILLKVKGKPYKYEAYECWPDS